MSKRSRIRVTGNAPCIKSRQNYLESRGCESLRDNISCARNLLELEFQQRLMCLYLQLIQLWLSFQNLKVLNSESARDDGFSPIRPLNSKNCLCSKCVFCRESSICLRYSCKPNFKVYESK
jgi:hypothetical protein